MLAKTIIAAGAILVSSLSFATENNEHLHGRPSTICYPAIAALQEPTTEANLTPYDPFKYLEPDTYSAIPTQVEPTTTAIAMWFLKAIAIELGNKIFEKHFGDPKRGLTEKDFERIDKIIRQALRDDAKRVIDDCVYNLQYNNKLIAGKGWDESLAREIYSTSTAVFNNIKRFPHIPSRIAMFPSAQFVGSMQLALGQELIKRNLIQDELFTRIQTGMADSVQGYLDETAHLVDFDSKDVYDFHSRHWICGKEKEHLCYEVRGKVWGQPMGNIWKKCEILDEDGSECMEEYDRESWKIAYWMNTRVINLNMQRLTMRESLESGPYTHIDEWKKSILSTPLREPAQ